MSERITITEAITLLAWGRSRTSDDLLAEARQAIRDRDPSDRTPLAEFEASLFGGMRKLNEAGDRILREARDGELKIFGRQARKETLWERTPRREALNDEDLREAIAFNVLHNAVVADERATAAKQAAASRVQYYDLEVERPDIEALGKPAIHREAPAGAATPQSVNVVLATHDTHRVASSKELHEAVTAAYDARPDDPPNIKLIAVPVQAALVGRGVWASKSRIMKVAEAPEFARRRRPPGRKRSLPR